MESQGGDSGRDVVLLWHVREIDGDEDAKLIGVYSSQERADEAVARKLRYPGFAEYPEGFSQDVYRVDRDAWSEGFITE